MRKIYILIKVLVLVLLLTSCSKKFTERIENQSNIEEIIDFKEYLLRINVMNDFKDFKKIDINEDDIVLNFCRKYNIRSVYIVPCKKTDGPIQSFKNCGNLIKMYYNNKYFIEANHSLIFDYSKDGLQLKEGLDPKKHRVADRIFVF